PLLELIVKKLIRHGAAEIHCNTFHLSEKIETFASRHAWPLRLHREEELLGTGGGIGNMRDGVSGADCILLHNGDILSDIPYGPAIELHGKREALVTLVLVPSGPRANVAVGPAHEVLAIGESAERLGRGASLLGYTGLAVLSPDSLPFFPRGKREHLVTILAEMMRKKPGSVIGWNAAEASVPYAWGDAGSPAGYLGIHRAILVDGASFDPEAGTTPGPIYIAAGANVDPAARCSGFCAIGRRAVVEARARLENCVVLDDTIVARDTVHSNEILFRGGMLEAAGGSRG
ncbi:MAG: NDP-sugar synthase, partial [Candidatus Krumholzibacteria bacterium]|nr:NDP-sugar synthase [Candidatus Krumholzibacteria bacterium]